mgnify:CR=1 FL=1
MKNVYKRLKRVKYLEDVGYINDYDKLVTSLRLLEIKNYEMYMHSVRVAKYSDLLAREFFDSEVDIDCVWVSALFHDIGKILVPNYILNNEDELSTGEFEIIKRHSYDGYKIAKNFLSEKLATPVLEHHERLNGEGYPFSKQSLSLETKIVAVADTFDAMTTDRVYQRALPKTDAINLLQQLSLEKSYYDIDVVEKLKHVIYTKNSSF